MRSANKRSWKYWEADRIEDKIGKFLRSVWANVGLHMVQIESQLITNQQFSPHPPAPFLTPSVNHPSPLPFLAFMMKSLLARHVITPLNCLSDAKQCILPFPVVLIVLLPSFLRGHHYFCFKQSLLPSADPTCHICLWSSFFVVVVLVLCVESFSLGLSCFL